MRPNAGNNTASAASPTFTGVVTVPDGTACSAPGVRGSDADTGFNTATTPASVCANGVVVVAATSSILTYGVNLAYLVATVTYAASTTIDFAAATLQTVTLTGNITFTTSNLAAGRGVTVRVICDSSTRTYTFPAWKFVGSAAPASCTANKVGLLSLLSFSTTDANVVAAYSEQP